MKELLNIKVQNKHTHFALQLVLILFWGFQLLDSDAYYVNYVLLLIISVFCVTKNHANDNRFKDEHDSRADVLINLFAIILSCMVTLANYELCLKGDYFGSEVKLCYFYIMAFILFIGGFLAFKGILTALTYNLKRLIWHKRETTVSPKIAFTVCFVLLLFTRMIILFFCLYPGVLTTDSINQMNQLSNGVYSNHHPFYHTMVIKFFVLIGMHLFKDINAAVATYSVFQIIFTSFCFSYAVSTLARMKIPTWILTLSILFFVFMPYHIIYAITMWKDIMFGCLVLLLVTAFFRCIYNIGHPQFDHLLLAFSCLGICLFRSNGFFVFAIITLAFVILWKAKNKQILMIFVSILIISFIMKHPVLTELGIAQPDTIESLSIPAQQIARVVKDGKPLNEREFELLDNVIDIGQIPKEYIAYFSDPIKDLVRQKGNQHLLIDRKADYIGLYLYLGIKYPATYLKAWIDQTRGYWNAGYEYWHWALWMENNVLGIERTTNSHSLGLILRAYLWLFENIQILKLLISIGAFVWTDLLMLMIALHRKDKVGIFISLPVLAIVVSLLLATPVAYEFRYIYAVFCCLPMVIVITLRPQPAPD